MRSLLCRGVIREGSIYDSNLGKEHGTYMGEVVQEYILFSALSYVDS